MEPDSSLIPKQEPQQPLKAPPHNSMWDAFEHILMFISLYVLATSVALLLHFFVNIWFPPVIDRFGSYSSSSYISSWQNGLVRGYLASIIVSFPFFAFLFLRITKRTKKNAEVRQIKTRKVLIYLTLIVTFIISLASIIGAVYNLLGGNVSINFIMHLVVTLGISGSIFVYYLTQVKEDRHFNG